MLWLCQIAALVKKNFFMHTFQEFLSNCSSEQLRLACSEKLYSQSFIFRITKTLEFCFSNNVHASAVTLPKLGLSIVLFLNTSKQLLVKGLKNLFRKTNICCFRRAAQNQLLKFTQEAISRTSFREILWRIFSARFLIRLGFHLALLVK